MKHHLFLFSVISFSLLCVIGMKRSSVECVVWGIHWSLRCSWMKRLKKLRNNLLPSYWYQNHMLRFVVAIETVSLMHLIHVRKEASTYSSNRTLFLLRSQKIGTSEADVIVNSTLLKTVVFSVLTSLSGTLFDVSLARLFSVHSSP